MNIGTLLSTLAPLATQVQATQLQETIQSAIHALSRLIPAQPGNSKAPFLAQVLNEQKELLAKLAIIHNALNVQSHIEAMRLLDADKLFGRGGQSRIEAIFSEAATQPQTARTMLQQYGKELQKLLQLQNTLSTFSPNLQSVYVSEPSEENVIDLIFKGKASISDLRDLERAAMKWNQALIGFAMLTRESDTTFKIHSVRKGSTILELIAYGQIVKSFGEAALKVLSVLKQALDTYKVALDIKRLSIPDLAKTEKEVESAAKVKVRAESTRIANELTEQYGWVEGDKRGDVTNAVRIAVEHMFKFMHNGGEVNIRLGSTPEGDRSIEVLLKEKRNEVVAKQAEIERLSGKAETLELKEGDEHGENEVGGQEVSEEPNS